MVTNKEWTIGIDMDDVVYKCVAALPEYLKTHYGLNYTAEDLAEWGRTGDDRDLKFEAFADPEFVLSQPLYEGAKKFVKELQKRGNVIAVTAVNANCLTARASAIMRDFGLPAENIITATQKNLVHLDFLIDDSPRNIRRSNCTYPILMRRTGSEAMSGVMSATKYEDIITFIDFIQNRRPLHKMPSNAIVCLVGPTGAGKTEMAAKLVEDKLYKRLPAYSSSKSKKYIHISETEFKKRMASGEFAEYTVYGGRHYGISVTDIEAVEPTDKVVCAVDICGAMALKNLFGSRVAIIFCDANRMECIKSILDRNMTKEEKAIRLAGIEAEFGNERFCDFTVRGLDDLLNSI